MAAFANRPGVAFALLQKCSRDSQIGIGCERRIIGIHDILDMGAGQFLTRFARWQIDALLQSERLVDRLALQAFAR